MVKNVKENILVVNKKTVNLNRVQNNKDPDQNSGTKKCSIWYKNFRMEMAGVMNLKIDQLKYPF